VSVPTVVCADDACTNTFTPKRRGRPRLYCDTCSNKAAYSRRWRKGERHSPPPKPYVRLLPREATCERCGATYTKTWGPQRYCGGPGCGEFVTVPCDGCGQDFEARVRDRERGWARFCGKPCATRTRSANETVAA
jgi:hypothetical protein